MSEYELNVPDIDKSCDATLYATDQQRHTALEIALRLPVTATQDQFFEAAQKCLHFLCTGKPE